MARSTCNPNRDAPRGMQKFEVIRSTIKDSVGQYCVPGDMAILNKKMAKSLLDKNWIKVALPEFDDADDEDEQAKSADGVGADAEKLAKVETFASTSSPGRRTRSSSDT